MNRHSKRFESIREDIRTKEREEYEAEQERLEIESRCYEWTHQAKLESHMDALGWRYQFTMQGSIGSCAFYFSGITITDRGAFSFEATTGLVNGVVTITDVNVY